MTGRALAGADEPDEVNQEVTRGLAALQQYVTDHATAPGLVTPGVSAPAGHDGTTPAGPGGGEFGSRRVRQLRAAVGEAHALLSLQADQAPLLVESARVRRRRLAAAQAARLHTLGRDPAMRAWRAARRRRVFTAMAMTALILALGWSTAGVQRFAATGTPSGSVAWWLAWLVEPLMSLALLSVVAARAFFASVGQPLEHRTLRRVERVFLGLILVMNVWAYLPGVAPSFEFAALLIHMLGPIVAVSVVTFMPIIWQQFAELDHGPTTTPATPGASGGYWGATGGEYRHNTPANPITTGGAGSPDLLARATSLIAAGVLPARPSASQLRVALGCGTDAARRVRDALAHHPTAGEDMP
jgi:hypothetical protein